MAFLRLLDQSKKQTAEFRVWNRVVSSISYNSKRDDENTFLTYK